jgi:endonuclease/exonuclease/phosphatase family metal-dependent hydrolase
LTSPEERERHADVGDSKAFSGVPSDRATPIRFVKTPTPWRWGAAAAVALGAVVLALGAREVPAGGSSGLGLREAAVSPAAEPPRAGEAERGSFRIGTFNIHGGRGRDSVRDLDRTARAIRSAGLDLVALQEVHGSAPGGARDQAEQLGRALRMGHLFAPTERQWWRDSFGNGLLASMSVGRWERIPLPSSGRASGHRSVLVAEAAWAGRPVRLAVTHLDRQEVHGEQLRAVIDLFLALEAPAVLLGDLNAGPYHPLIQDLLARPGVDDPVGRLADPPAKGIDWILTRGLEAAAAGRLDEGASDHPLVWAELRTPADVGGAK